MLGIIIFNIFKNGFCGGLDGKLTGANANRELSPI